MIAFLIGGEGRFMDAMINKLNKDGHRVYLLTGTKNSHTSYQKGNLLYRTTPNLFLHSIFCFNLSHLF